MVDRESQRRVASVPKGSIAGTGALHPALAVFLRDRGGKKAEPTKRDHILGANALSDHKSGLTEVR